MSLASLVRCAGVDGLACPDCALVQPGRTCGGCKHRQLKTSPRLLDGGDGDASARDHSTRSRADAQRKGVER